MNQLGHKFYLSSIALLLLLSAAFASQTFAQGSARITSSVHARAVGNSMDPWSANSTIKPQTLAKELSGKQKDHLVVIHVGPAMLYRSGHVPGSLAGGEASEPRGAASLKSLLQTLPKDKTVVFYCGCCPWMDCPNIRPAYTIAHDLGFKNIKILDLPTTFKTDWVAKGLPVQK